MDHALELRSITKEFPGVRAVDDVTLQVRPGSVHALIGENGAGKSTLMKILDGVYPAGTFQGEILLDGAPVRFHSPHDAGRQGIGYVPQEINVIEGLTVAENIYVGRWNGGRRSPIISLRRLYQLAEELLEENGINLDPRGLVSSLSASQRQLVMIARALAGKPSVLILDEATACLTLEETRHLFSVVNRLRGQGGAILLITHKLEELFEIADRATVLRDGKVVANFERATFDKHAIVAAMVGRKIETFYPSRSRPPEPDELLRVEQLTVPHPRIVGRSLVQDLSFSLRRGEILGLGGLVGSGRSETVNAIYGRLPHQGRILLDGREIRVRTPRDARTQGIGLLPEERKREGLLFNFAIRENISLHSLRAVSQRGWISRGRETQSAEEFRQRLSIRCRAVREPVLNLSGGNQQKVVLAKVLMPNPKVLLLDEPTKGVDVGAKAEIYKIITGLADAGIGIIVISSELPELFALSDRILVLHRGRVADEFERGAADENRFMLAATGGSATH